jgi:uncharacterized protein YcgI (DUF1989 family)
MTNEYIVERDGFAFVVPENHNFKFELLAGQQILDVAFWSKENPKNKFLSMHYTLFRNGLFITKGSKLWSDYKIREVIMECVDETKYKSTKDGWFHHFLAGYCDDRENTGPNGRSCKTNFLESIHEFGLYEENLNDNTINLFTKVKSKQNGFFQWAKSDAKVGDYITFKSYIDLIVSVSLCPAVDWPYRYTKRVNPIKVVIYD